MRSSRFILSLPLSLGALPGAAQIIDAAAVEDTGDYRPQREPLDQALINYGVETGISVIFDRRLTDGKFTGSIDSDLPPDIALTKLLSATDLQFKRVRDDLWAVLPNDQQLEPDPTLFADKPDADDRESRRKIGDTIIVGATRIQRSDLRAPSPVTTVSSEQLVLTNTINSEQFLNTLPQIIPSFDQTSNNPGNGSARVDLRGLGAERTLVLVDGARFVGLGPNFVVDLNNIPSALVERIDVVTGGQSAIYGSDAVAGVVNFILRKDFEGVQLDVSHELSAAGWDANQTNVAITIGGNFANGLGNAVVFASYTDRRALLQGDRAFSRVPYWDPGPGSNVFVQGGSSTIPQTRFRGATSSNFNIAPETIDPLCGVGNANSCMGFFNAGGTGAAGDIRGLRFGGVDGETDLFNFAPSNYLQLPQERFNVTTLASYEINDHIEAYMHGLFSHTIVDRQLAPTPFRAFMPVVINIDNPNIPAALLSIITGDTGSYSGGPTATIGFQRRFLELGARNDLRTTNSFQILTGLRGKFNKQWSYDTFLSFSRSTVDRVQTGNVSTSAIQAAVLCDAGPTAVLSGCAAPYLDIFGGAGAFSPAALAFVGRTGIKFDEIEQTQWVGTLSGDLENIRTPWAETGVAMVVGLEYRELSANSIPDSVLGPDVRGFDGSLAVGGRYDVYEAFGEVQIPILTGKPFFDRFVINGAYRYSDYSVTNVGGVHTFAVGGDWLLILDLRFRAQFQRAVRAPNIAELFSDFTSRFPNVQDPCSSGLGSFSPATSVTTCTATGVPASNVGAGFQSNGQIQILAGGNPNLFHETGDTLTIGMVWEPEPVVGLTLQIDYYDIQIENVVTVVGLQTILDECHLLNVAAQCSILASARDPATGVLGGSPATSPLLGSVNAATTKVRGIDTNISYGFDFWDGAISAQYYGTYTLESEFRNSVSEPVLACAGKYGLECGEPKPEYKHTFQLGYIQGPLIASLRWRAIGGVTADNATLALVGDLSDNIGFTNYIDITTQYAVNDSLDLTVGVKNITGKDAPILGSTASEQANTWPATYTPFGRQVFFGASLRF